MRGDLVCACGEVLLRGTDPHQPEQVTETCHACGAQPSLFAAPEHRCDSCGGASSYAELSSPALHEQGVLGARLHALDGQTFEITLVGLTKADVAALSRRLRYWRPERVRLGTKC